MQPATENITPTDMSSPLWIIFYDNRQITMTTLVKPVLAEKPTLQKLNNLLETIVIFQAEPLFPHLDAR